MAQSPVATEKKTTTEQFLEDFNKDLSPELKYKKLLFILPDQVEEILTRYFHKYGGYVYIPEARENIMRSIKTIMGG